MPNLPSRLGISAGLLLFALPALAQQLPELLCEPDAKVTFQHSWIHGGSVTLESGTPLSLPWTGKETMVGGKQIKESREDLAEIPDGAAFLAFREGASRLFIQRSLLGRNENDGLVILQTASAAPALYHCRSR